MKSYAVMIASLAALAGCATHPNYASRAYPPPADPSQWHVVSVTPVPVGTGAQAAASGQAAVTTPNGPRVTYTTPTTVQAVPQTVYVPQPVYVERPRYTYPPISIGLGFGFGRGGWGHRHRGWSGHIGTHWPY